MSIYDLPDELFTNMIFPQLDIHNLINISEVSRRFNKVAKDVNMNILIYFRDGYIKINKRYYKKTENLLKIKYKKELINKYNIENFINNIRGSGWKNLKLIYINSQRFLRNEDLILFKDFDGIYLENPILITDITSLSNTNIKYIYIHKIKMNNIYIDMSGIDTLVLSGYRGLSIKNRDKHNYWYFPILKTYILSNKNLNDIFLIKCKYQYDINYEMIKI